MNLTRIPLIQAPMAGVSTAALAAAVSNAGGLGSIAIGGASHPSSARASIEAVRKLTDQPFNVNVFTHAKPQRDSTKEKQWIEHLRPRFAEYGAEPPESLRVIYKSFNDDIEMQEMLLEEKVPVVSFHFGLPPTNLIKRFKERGTYLLATVTSSSEAIAAEEAGIDAIIAQGIEAGGHRGVFNPTLPDDGLGTFALTRLLVKQTRLPVIVAGGIMDGAGVSAALRLGASAAQLGTAFVFCPESAADEGYRAALANGSRTWMTRAVSGRPARSLESRFTELLNDDIIPDYPIAYDLGKALHAAAKKKGDIGYGALWAGQGVALGRVMPASELVCTIAQEMALYDN